MGKQWLLLAGLIVFGAAGNAIAETSRPIRQLAYDPEAPAVDLLSKEAGGKLRVRVIPQNEFRSRVRIENLTENPLTVRLPKAAAAVHVFPKAETDPPASRVRETRPRTETEEKDKAPGQAVVGTFGPMEDPLKPFPHESETGGAFTIPGKKSVEILLHTACAEHGKLTPFSRMTYRLKPLDDEIENKTLQKIVKTYDPQKIHPLAFQAAVWHLANGMSWKDLAAKTSTKGGIPAPYFTRRQLLAAQKLIKSAEKEKPSAGTR